MMSEKEMRPNRDHPYYRSPIWKAKRQFVLLLAKGICQWQGCGFKADNIHHTKDGYKRFGGGELPGDLQALCRFHHQKVHGIEAGAEQLCFCFGAGHAGQVRCQTHQQGTLLGGYRWDRLNRTPYGHLVGGWKDGQQWKFFSVYPCGFYAVPVDKDQGDLWSNPHVIVLDLRGEPVVR